MARPRLRHVVLALGALGVLALVVLGGAAWWLATSEQTLEWLAAEAARRTGGRLVIESPRGSAAGPIAAPRITFDDGDVRVVAEEVRIGWSPLALLDRRVRIATLDAARVTVTTRPSGEPPQPPPSLALPIAVDVAQVRIGRLDFDGTVIRDIAGAYAGGPDGHAVRGLRADGDFGRVHADGRIAAAPPYMLRADAFLLHDLAAVRVLASGTLEDVAADLTVLSHGAEAVGSAQLRPFAPQVVAAVTLIAEGIDPAAFDASLPRADLRATLDGAQTAAALLAGTLQARNAAPGFVADGAAPLQTLAARFRVEGETLVLEDTRASLGAAGEVTGSARLGRERGDAELAFTAIDLRGLHRTLRTTRMSGTASVGYEGDTQRVSARVSERGAVLALEATRRGDRVDVKRAEAAFGRSRAEGRGEVSLAGNQPFTASVRLIDLDPADFGDFPGARLNGEARARGRLAPQWAADVTVDLANSRYRDAALAGTFRGAVSATQVRDGELRLRLGENALRASGTYGLKGGSIAFELDAPRPGQVEPRAGGRLSARGRIEGTPRDPLLTVEVDGDKLAWNGRQWTERVRASLAGTIGAHSLTVDGRIADRPVQAAARGGWSEARWRGRVETLEVGGDYPFEIDGEMPLEAGADELAAGPGRARFAGGRLEVEFVRWREQRLASAGAFAALPALPFLRLGGVVMHEKTDLRLNGRWDVRASPALDGTVTLAYESGDLVLPTDPPVAAGVRRLEGDAKLVNDAISAQARLDSRIGSARATVSTGGVARTSALRAEGTAVIPNLKPFEGLVGTTAVVDGRVQLEFAASGTLGSPLINATLVGDGMRVDAPLYGVSLRDGEFRATLMDSVLRLERFIAVADRGRFVASGVMPLGGRDPQARLEWQAVDLALFNRPDRRLQVDGQGTLALENGRLALRGELKADSAYFEFERPPVAQLDNDIEIRGRPRPPRAEAFRSSLLDIDLTLDFGSNFRILGAGLETQLRGKLAVQTARDGSLVGRGTVTSERGSYYAFGQKLTIERGQLIFDGPIANPSLDVLAVRKGLAVEAGVEVSGTVQVPRIRLVSNPPVPDAEKLTWLTLGTGPEALTGANLALVQAAAATVMRGDSSLPLGRRVAQAVGLDDITVRGTGAAGSQVVAFGKRLSDRVYIEYEQGMVATNAIVRLSYALSRYFSASAETGRSTGGGLYYRRNFK